MADAQALRHSSRIGSYENRIYTSNAQILDPVFVAADGDLMGKYVGAVDPYDFLQVYLPNHLEGMPSVDHSKFKNIASQLDETKMYDLMVRHIFITQP
jgi:hypothetical protein